MYTHLHAENSPIIFDMLLFKTWLTQPRQTEHPGPSQDKVTPLLWLCSWSWAEPGLSQGEPTPEPSKSETPTMVLARLGLHPGLLL